VMVIAVVLLNHSMRLTTQSRKLMEYSQSLDQLSRQFRRDVRRAETAQLQTERPASPETRELILAQPDGLEVRYRFHHGGKSSRHVERNVFSNGQRRAGNSFRLLPAARAVFKELERPQRILLEVHSSEGDAFSTNADTSLPISARLDRRTTAIVGRLLDLERRESN